MAEEMTLRLIGSKSPSGEIALPDLAAIAASLHEVSLRLGRTYFDAAGPGRTRRGVEELVELRLRAVTGGSTTLTLERGPTEVLDVEVPQVQALSNEFWTLLEAVGKGERPDGVSDLVAESAGSFAVALRQAAPKAELTMGSRAPIVMDTQVLHRETWIAPRPAAGDTVVVSGLLEKVDLGTHAFRIRDAVGNGIDLQRVPNDRHVAGFIGRQITAEGPAVMDRRGRLSALASPAIRLDLHPARDWTVPPDVPLAEILESAPGPDPSGVIDLSDDELAAFLEAARS